MKRLAISLVLLCGILCTVIWGTGYVKATVNMVRKSVKTGEKVLKTGKKGDAKAVVNGAKLSWDERKWVVRIFVRGDEAAKITHDINMILHAAELCDADEYTSAAAELDTDFCEMLRFERHTP